MSKATVAPKKEVKFKKVPGTNYIYNIDNNLVFNEPTKNRKVIGLFTSGVFDEEITQGLIDLAQKHNESILQEKLDEFLQAQEEQDVDVEDEVYDDDVEEQPDDEADDDQDPEDEQPEDEPEDIPEPEPVIPQKSAAKGKVAPVPTPTPAAEPKPSQKPGQSVQPISMTVQSNTHDSERIAALESSVRILMETVTRLEKRCVDLETRVSTPRTVTFTLV